MHIHSGWKKYYRYRETVYEIDVRQQSRGESSTIMPVDGIKQQDEAFPLVDDRRNRSVRIALRAPILNAFQGRSR
jgi:hypothetical protein